MSPSRAARSTAGSHQLAADATALELLGHAGVDQRDPVAVDRVGELPGVTVPSHLEAALGCVVD